MSNYQNAITQLQERLSQSHSLNPEHIVRMRVQNRFQTGLDIARHTASIMRRDIAAYDENPEQYTQSLGMLARFCRDSKN